MKYLVQRIDEDIDYGCEERRPDQPVLAVVTLQTPEGEEEICKVADAYLYAQEINEGDTVFRDDEGRLQKWLPGVEYFDIVDLKGEPTGGIVSRETAHRKGIRHRTAHIWILREEQGRMQVLLQKRSMNKDSFPGKLDTSSAGHIQAGDGVRESALRELQEELGICAEEEDLKFVGTFAIGYVSEFHGKPFRDKEVAFVYTYEKPVKEDELVIQKEELESVVWCDYEETLGRCRNRDAAYCCPVGGLKLIRRER